MSIPTQRKTALVTGASSGIGLAFAQLCAKDGMDVILVARNTVALDALAEQLKKDFGVMVTVLAKDLSDAEALKEIVLSIQKNQQQIDILINNAGFGTFGFFVETEWEKEAQMVQVNVVALTYLTKSFLPGMILRGHGNILNVASVAAFQPGPLMAVYYATKAFVLSFSEAIANECRGTGVTVTALCPGPTISGFQKVAAMDVSKLFSGKTLPTSREVAQAGYLAMKQGKTVVIYGLKNKFFVQLLRIAPRRLVTMVVRRLQGTKNA